MRQCLAGETGLQIDAAAVVQLLGNVAHYRHSAVLGIGLLDHQEHLLFGEILDLIDKHSLIERWFL